MTHLPGRTASATGPGVGGLDARRRLCTLIKRFRGALAFAFPSIAPALRVKPGLCFDNPDNIHAVRASPPGARGGGVGLKGSRKIDMDVCIFGLVRGKKKQTATSLV